MKALTHFDNPGLVEEMTKILYVSERDRLHSYSANHSLPVILHARIYKGELSYLTSGVPVSEA